MRKMTFRQRKIIRQPAILQRMLLAFILLIFFTPALAKTPFTVAIFIFDEVQIIDFSAPYEVFGQADFNVFTVSANGEPVTTAMGLSVNPTYSFETMPKADAILVPGGDTHKIMHDKAVRSWLNAQQKITQHILSVCTGAHILAEAGMLDGKSATTFHRALNSFEKDYPAVSVNRNKRFVDNGQIVTSAGLSSGIDASLHLVSEVLGVNKARTVALDLEYDWDREGKFVRAQMADRMLPDNDYDWPEGISVDRLSAFGDEKKWQIQYQIRSSATPDLFMAVYETAMARHDDWKYRDNDEALRGEWVGVNSNMGWHMSVSIIADDAPDTYIFTLGINHRP